MTISLTPLDQSIKKAEYFLDLLLPTHDILISIEFYTVDKIATHCSNTLDRHTGRFDSKFSHICKTNTKFGLLYERGPRINIGVKYTEK